MFARIFIVIRHAIHVWRVLSLPKNRSKGTWRDMTTYQLLTRAEEELAELKAAVWQHENGGPLHRVQSEAADVTAFLAMLVDVCRHAR